MTTPPTPPPAPPAPAPPPAPPTPSGGPPADPPKPPDPPAPPTTADLAKMQAALAEERRARQDTQRALDDLKRQGMTDQEKAVAAAKEEGRAEAEKAAAQRLAAAEFRVAATGRLVNPDAALSALDLGKLVGKDGEPDRKAIAALVDQLAAVPAPAPPGGMIPGGPRETAPANGDADWIRTIGRRPRGR